MDIVRTSMCRASRNALRAFFALAVLCVSFSTALSAVSQVIRSTEYSITLGQFTGTTYTLTLNQTLASDYFIIVRGGIDTSIDSAATPDYEYARVSAVPSGKGDLPDSGASNQITLARYASDQNWVGIVTVVECLAGTAGPGFKLITIDEITMANGVDTGTSTAPATWPSGQLAQIVPIGGYRGGGAAFTEDVPFDATGPAMGQSILTKLTRSGTSTIGWKRDAGGSTLKAAVMTVFVIQWGFEWTVQSVNVAGTNAGDGVDATGEYTTAAITSVVRADTWVWGCGFTTTSTAGNNAEACVVTLGDGVNENATETAVAVGCDEAASYDFQVYTMTQSRIAVDHAKLADGNSTALTVGVTMGQSATTSTERMSVAYNTCDGTSTTRQTRCRFRSNFTANDTITLTRGYQGTEFAAWVQSIDFSPLRTLLITGSNPAINKIDHTGTNVSVTFTDPNPANYTTGWYTTSSMTGRKSYGISLSFGNTIQRQGLTPNFDGECVETTLTTTISKSGHPLGNPRVWRWWRATGASSGDWTGDNINIGGATTYTHDSDVGDVDGDGDLDIAVAYANATINVVWLNDGTGAFPSSIDIGTEAEETRRIKFLDFDRDGDLDIFVANNGVNRMYTYAAGAYTLQFTSAQSDASFGLAVGDMNADSYPDVVVTNNNTAFTTNQLYINNYGTLGTYTCTMRNLGNTNVKSRDCDIGDVDNDGDLDIGITVFSALGGQNFIYLMDSSGWVESTVNVGPTLVNSRTIDFGDFNGD
ncbi:MAG: VCBS repeat-containing protein, partial [Planctomycetaceae bacterium]|nr:VCBS repeat-containing protein [Planctomycetaceae bacterium]